MHVLLPPLLPATFRFVYPPGDSEAFAHLGDVTRGVEVLVSVRDPVLRYGAWLATLQSAGRPETLGSPP